MCFCVQIDQLLHVDTFFACLVGCCVFSVQSPPHWQCVYLLRTPHLHSRVVTTSFCASDESPYLLRTNQWNIRDTSRCLLHSNTIDFDSRGSILYLQCILPASLKAGCDKPLIWSQLLCVLHFLFAAALYFLRVPVVATNPRVQLLGQGQARWWKDTLVSYLCLFVFVYLPSVCVPSVYPASHLVVWASCLRARGFWHGSHAAEKTKSKKAKWPDDKLANGWIGRFSPGKRFRRQVMAKMVILRTPALSVIWQEVMLLCTCQRCCYVRPFLRQSDKIVSLRIYPFSSVFGKKCILRFDYLTAEDGRSFMCLYFYDLSEALVSAELWKDFLYIFVN